MSQVDGVIHGWGSQKDCLMGKGIHSPTLFFYNIYCIIITMYCCVLIVKMMSYCMIYKILIVVLKIIVNFNYYIKKIPKEGIYK